MAKSICYNCSDRSTSCHTTCKAYQAEVMSRDYDRSQRIKEMAGRYRNERLWRNSIRQVQFNRSGGR